MRLAFTAHYAAQHLSVDFQGFLTYTTNMIIPGSTFSSPLSLGVKTPSQEEQTAQQTAPIAAVSGVVNSTSSETTSDSTYATAPADGAGAPAGGPPAGGAPAGAPPATTTTDEEIDLAVLARVRALVGASEAENVLNDDGSINYQKLSETLAQQQQKADATAARPTPVVDLVA